MAFKSISLAAIGLVFSTTVNAATITQNFSLTENTGQFAGTTGNGTFTYDEINIIDDGFGNFFIRRSEGLTIEFTVFGQTYTEDDEIGIGLEDVHVPKVHFNQNNDVLGIDFAVSELLFEENGLFSTVVNINEGGIDTFEFISDLALQNGSYVGSMAIIETSAVPVPAAAWLFGSGLLGLVGVARRKKA